MRLLRRLPSPGTAPGSVPESHPSDAPVRLTMTIYDLGHFEEIRVDSVADLPVPPPDRFWWLDIEGHHVHTIAAVSEKFGLHPLLVEDMINLGQRPKMELYGDTFFLVAEHLFSIPIHRSARTDQSRDSVRTDSSRCANGPTRSSIPSGDGSRPGGRGFAEAGPDISHTLSLMFVVDHLFSVLQQIGDSFEDLEEPMLDDPTQDQLNSVHRLKRDVLRLRKSVWPLREMITTTVREEDGVFSGRHSALPARCGRPCRPRHRHHRDISRDAVVAHRPLYVQRVQPHERGHEGAHDHRHDLHPAVRSLPGSTE